MSSRFENPPDSAILETARRLLETEGEAALTMDRLAALCGLSRATLYRRVGGRAELLKQLALPAEANARGRILLAARAVLQTSASFDFTVEQVAAQAGVGVATVYRQFGSKEALFQAVAHHVHPRRAARDLLEHAGEDIQGELEQFVQTVVEFMQEQQFLARLIFSSDPKVRELFSAARSDQERTLNTLTRYLTAQIKAGRLGPRDPFDLATALLGMVLGFVFVKPFYTHQEEDAVTISRIIVTQFLTGAR